MPASSRRSPKIKRLVFRPVAWVREKSTEYLSRRPHRSFRRTRRRDCSRSLTLPGYMAFTRQVNKTLWTHRKIFAWLIVIYSILTAVLIGVASQDSYTALTDGLRDAGAQIFGGDVAQVGTASQTVLQIATSGFETSATDVQQVYSVLMSLLAWLATVWLLRNLLAGHKVRVRDGLYSSGAPIIATFLVAVVLVVQLLPLALAVLGYAAASASGLLAGGVEAMLFWAAAGLLGLLSLYLVTSTFFALIIVTLPGMYPLQALRAAGDMVMGRRTRILLRFLWMLLNLVVTWAVVLIPVILFDTWLKGVWSQIQGLPLIPVVLLILGSFTVIWTSAYVYLLYRKVVDDGAKPA